MRTIIKNTPNNEIKKLVREYFFPGVSTRALKINRKEGYRIGLHDGLEVGKIFASDRGGIRRTWTVMSYESSGRFGGMDFGEWALRYTAHQTAGEKAEMEAWLQTPQAQENMRINRQEREAQTGARK